MDATGRGTDWQEVFHKISPFGGLCTKETFCNVSKQRQPVKKGSPLLADWCLSRPAAPAILNLHEPNRNKLFLNRTCKDSNFKRPPIYATLFQIENCCSGTNPIDGIWREAQCLFFEKFIFQA